MNKGKLLMPLSIEGVEIYDGWEQDGSTFGHNTQKQIVGATYGVVGAIIGAKIGVAVGLFFFGVGSLPALIIGAFVGGFIGGLFGEEGGEYTYDKLVEITK